MKLRSLSPHRRAFWFGALFLVIFEVLSALIRAHFLRNAPFFHLPAIYLGLAILKGLCFGPILGVLTWKIAEFWRRKMWDEACYGCLRGGFALCGTQAFWAVGCLLSGARVPFFAWLTLSWLHFALWLTLNVTLIWALLLVVAGFLLPHDARKTIQISDKVRF